MHLEETYAPREENWFDKEREKGMRQRLAIRMPFQDSIRPIRNAKDRAGRKQTNTEYAYAVFKSIGRSANPKGWGVLPRLPV
jgi:hypothetical protein